MKYDIDKRLFLKLSRNGLLRWIPDEIFLKIMYLIFMKKRLNIKEPQRYNEKLQWLKIHDRNEKYSMMVDKYLVKEYVKEKIGEEYVIPLLGVWNNASEIDYESLPNQFVLKCNHDSGSTIVCKDKDEFDKGKAAEKLNSHLKKNKFDYGREWSYKNVKPKVIAEELLVDKQNNDIFDYKIYCFWGEPKLIMVNSGRGKNKTTANFYDTEYNLLDFQWKYPINEKISKISKELFNTMLEKARILSKNIPHVRVDFYETGGSIYFGELTFFNGSGFETFESDEWEYKMGEWLVLPN